MREGRVSLNGVTVRDPEFPSHAGDLILVDGSPLASQERVWAMCNKPRGLVTTASDEQGRDTVFTCLQGLGLPHVGPVGRLDKASEGLLLFTNDTELAQALLEPTQGIPKVYHVQVRGVPEAAAQARMLAGIEDAGERLQASRVAVIRGGGVNCWLEVELCEGRNREIRRMLEVLGHEVLRLVRISFGPLALGDLAKGSARLLTSAEVDALRRLS